MRATLLGGLAASALALTPAAAQETAPPDGPFRLSATYTADLWRNARGGLRRGNAYLDNLDLALEIDAERAVGWKGATVLISGLHNNDQRLSERLAGDLQVASNIDTFGATRLYEAWVEQEIPRGSLKAGVIDLNSEFDVDETRALFINSSHGVGPELSQVGATGPSIFPITGLGARILTEPEPGWSLKLAAFDGAPGDPEHPRRTRFELNEDEGALLIAEVAHRAPEGHRLALGGWRHTGEMRDFKRLGSDGEAGVRTGSWGGYAAIETGPQAMGPGSLRLFARIGVADARAHAVTGSLGVGAVLSGPLIGFQEEALGFAVSVAELGRFYRRAAALGGTSLGRREINLELTYRIRPAPWLTLQPDVQYVIDPGADHALRDALLFGLRLELSLPASP